MLRVLCCLDGLDVFLLGGALGFEDDALEFFEDGELFVGVINLGVTLFFGVEEADFFEAFEFALDVASVFFDQLGQTADVGFKIRVFGVDDDDLTADSGCNKYVKHNLFPLDLYHKLVIVIRTTTI